MLKKKDTKIDVSVNRLFEDDIVVAHILQMPNTINK